MTEEQIKQKAEEYASSDKDKIDIIRTVKDWHLRKNGFLAGYLECQKEHEWHYMKDGDLPKEEGEYLVIFESDGTKYKGLESYYSKEWSTICKIIAWKEIVLPEHPKEM